MASIPGSHDVRWYQRAGVWFGSGINPATISIGGGLATRISAGAVLLLFPLGLAALIVLTLGQSLIARRRRQPLTLRTEDAFGTGHASKLFTLMIALGIAGWLSFFIGLGGFTLADMFNLPEVAGAVGVLVATVLLSEFGINRWSMLVWVTAVAALMLAIVAVVVVDAKPDFATWRWDFTFQDVIWVLGTVIAFAIVHAIRSADFTWDMRRDEDVIAVSVLWMVPFWTAVTIGVLLYQATGDWNIAELLAKSDRALLGQIFLIIAIASPMLGATYTGSLAVSSLTGLTQRRSVWLLCGLSFLLGVTRFDQQLLVFLDLLGPVLPSALVVMLVSALLQPKLSHRAAFFSWLVGAFAGLGLYTWGNEAHTVFSILVTIGVIFCCHWFAKANVAREVL